VEKARALDAARCEPVGLRRTCLQISAIEHLARGRRSHPDSAEPSWKPIRRSPGGPHAAKLTTRKPVSSVHDPVLADFGLAVFVFAGAPSEPEEASFEGAAEVPAGAVPGAPPAAVGSTIRTGPSGHDADVADDHDLLARLEALLDHDAVALGAGRERRDGAPRSNRP
jgi:hypothetical protein